MPTCKLKSLLNEARDAFLDVLDRHSLQDLVDQPQVIRGALSWQPPNTDHE